MKEKFKNSLKIIIYSPFISPLIITIVGSALWEKFLSPSCTYIYIRVSSLIDNFVTTFSNNTYKKISEGYNVPAANNFIYYSLLILIIAFYIVIMYKNIKSIAYDIDSNCKIKLLFKKHLLSFCFIIAIQIPMLLSMYFLGKLTFIDSCKTSSLCNLEIVSPYISDLEYKELKSTFYSIQDKEDYDYFTDRINEIGKKYSLNLKDRS